MLVEGMIIKDETYLFMSVVTRAFLSGRDEGDRLFKCHPHVEWASGWGWMFLWGLKANCVDAQRGTSKVLEKNRAERQE